MRHADDGFRPARNRHFEVGVPGGWYGILDAVTLRSRLRARGLRIHWAWVPAGLFGIFAAWYRGGLVEVALLLAVAVGLIALATRPSKRG